MPKKQVSSPPAVVGDPFWYRPASNFPQRRVQGVQGIHPFYPGEVGPTGCGCVDASIASLIAVLNLKGYQTWVSCSGLPEDHQEGHQLGAAYIGFSDAALFKKLWNKVFEPAGFERATMGGTAYMFAEGRQYARVNPNGIVEEMRNRWSLAWELTQKLTPKSASRKRGSQLVNVDHPVSVSWPGPVGPRI